MSDSSLERRREPRVTVEVTVEVSDGRGFTLFSTRDISVGGLYFDRAIPHAVGEAVQLKFTLPGEERAIACEGEVVNVPNAAGFGMGVRFTTLADTDRQLLESFVQQMQAEGR